MHSLEELVVIGAGNWGLALACLFSKNLPTRVWTRDAARADDLNAHRDQPGQHYRFPIPAAVTVEQKFASDLNEERTLIIIAVPSGNVGEVAAELASRVTHPTVIAVSKGFDVARQCTMSELIKHHIPGAAVIVLTGPTIANEVAEGKPTRAVLASDDLMHLAAVKAVLQNDVIAFEVSRNPTHHEICAALKGIVAIAVGMADGLELGANMQGVLMTEGIRELGVVASFFGIPSSVAYGLSGAGDLITTCVSRDSRNRRLGSALARELSLEDALKSVGMTVEGVAMSRTIETLWTLDVSIPLIHTVNSILLGTRRDVRAELRNLMAVL